LLIGALKNNLYSNPKLGKYIFKDLLPSSLKRLWRICYVYEIIYYKEETHNSNSLRISKVKQTHWWGNISKYIFQKGTNHQDVMLQNYLQPKHHTALIYEF